MVKKISHFKTSNNKYRLMVIKLLLIVIVYILLQSLFRLPYFNIMQHVFIYSPHVVVIYLIITLFRPAKELILIIALLLFVPNLFFYLFKNQTMSELLSVISYFLFFSYILLSRKILNK